MEPQEKKRRQASARHPLITVILWITSPIWVPVWVILVATELRFLPNERRLRRQMKSVGRMAPLEVLGSGGTIIDDMPTMSWGIARLWWTPDDVLREAPIPPPTDEERHRAPPPWSDEFQWHAFDRWVWERYLNPASGTAILLRAWRVHSLLQKVGNRYPACRLVESFSGGNNYENFPPLASADARPATE